MNLEIRSVPMQHTAARGTDIPACAAQGSSPYLLERIYIRIGRPGWYWPMVLTMLLVLIVAGSSCSPEAELYV